MNREKFYTMTAQLYTFAVSNPAVYGSSPTYSAGSTFSCIIDAISGNEAITAQKEIAESTHYLECGTGTTISVKDRIVSGGNTYEVTFVDNPMNMNVCQEIFLRLRT